MTALLSAATGLHQEPLPDFVLVKTADIRRDDRLRPVDPSWAAALGQVMLREGQRTPIEICRLPASAYWTLVAGGHRHAGAELSGIEYLRAEIVYADRDYRRMREVSENLWRRDLHPIDRAAFVAEAVAIHKRRAGIDPKVDGRVGSAAVRWQQALKAEAEDANVTMTFAYGFTEAVAAELGFSSSKVARDLLLYNRLAPSLVERLRNARHPDSSNAAQLRALAKLDEHAQAKVVDLLLVPSTSLNYEQPKTIADAIAHPLGPKPGKPKPAAEDQRYSSVLGTVQRMSSAELIGLFQSPQFHDLMPAEARKLLAPMRRDQHLRQTGGKA